MTEPKFKVGDSIIYGAWKGKIMDIYQRLADKTYHYDITINTGNELIPESELEP